MLLGIGVHTKYFVLKLLDEKKWLHNTKHICGYASLQNIPDVLRRNSRCSRKKLFFAILYDVTGCQVYCLVNSLSGVKFVYD